MNGCSLHVFLHECISFIDVHVHSSNLSEELIT